jgi:hypothetical protein
MIILDRCFDLALHHDAAKGVAVLEYASEGHVVGRAGEFAENSSDSPGFACMDTMDPGIREDRRRLLARVEERRDQREQFGRPAHHAHVRGSWEHRELRVRQESEQFRYVGQR